MIRWSQPEIVLYDDDPYIRMSYPDLVEDGGKFYLTETQKNIGPRPRGRSGAAGGLWGQFDEVVARAPWAESAAGWRRSRSADAEQPNGNGEVRKNARNGLVTDGLVLSLPQPGR